MKITLWAQFSSRIFQKLFCHWSPVAWIGRWLFRSVANVGSVCLFVSLDTSVDSRQSSFVRRPSRRRKRRLSVCSDSHCDSKYTTHCYSKYTTGLMYRVWCCSFSFGMYWHLLAGNAEIAGPENDRCAGLECSASTAFVWVNSTSLIVWGPVQSCSILFYMCRRYWCLHVVTINTTASVFCVYNH